LKNQVDRAEKAIIQLQLSCSKTTGHTKGRTHQPLQNHHSQVLGRYKQSVQEIWFVGLWLASDKASNDLLNKAFK
jgi:hypothetical protein